MSFVYGCATGWLSPTLPLLQSADPAVGTTSITEEETAWLSSLPFLGALVASPIFSFICQSYGRKAGGYFTAIPFMASWILIMFANTIPQLYIARFLAGLAYGGTIVFVPMYTGEIAEDNIRGALGAFLPLLCNLATVFTYSLGPYVSIQMLAIVCFIPTTIFLFVFFWLPETPTYLISKENTEMASQSMLWLRGNIREIAEKDLQKVKDLLQKKDPSSKKSTRALLFSRGTLKALTICLVVCIAQQFSGVYIILNYCTEIMSKSASALSPSIASISVAAIQLLGAILATFCVEVFGRRIMLIFSQAVMGLCLAVLGTYFYFQDQGYDMTSLSVLPIICVSLYLFTNATGVAPITYILISETLHPDIRGIATTIATSNIWALAFLITTLYPVLLGLLGLAGCYWAFASVCVFCIIFTIFQIPETKNRSLQSILDELNGVKT